MLDYWLAFLPKAYVALGRIRCAKNSLILYKIRTKILKYCGADTGVCLKRKGKDCWEYASLNIISKIA